MELNLWHILIMLLTVALVIGAGIYSSRAVRSSEGYSLSGRSAGSAMVAGSIAGTIVGGGATVGTAQMAFSVGLSAWWFTLGSGIACILMGIFYAKPLRRSALETIPQYLTQNYGRGAGTVCSVVSSAGILFSAVASCLPGIQILSAILGINTYASAMLLVIIVGIYAFFGGMKSAGIGGLLKMGIIWVSLAIAGICAALTLQEMDAVVYNSIFTASTMSLLGIGTGNAMTNLLSVVVGVVCTQTYIQCIFSAMNPRAASIGMIIAALIVIPVGLPSVAIGMYMHALEPGMIPILVLPAYLVNHMPVWLAGIALGGIMLSLIGSIGGLCMGIGTMLSRDCIMRLMPGLATGEQGKLLLMRTTVVCVMLVACAIAILNLDTQILTWNYMSMALRGGGVFIPLTVAIFAPHSISPVWAVGSMIISTVAAVISGTVFSGYLTISPLFVGLIISAVLCAFGFRRAG